MTYESLAAELGRVCDQKNQAYGSSFSVSGDFMRLLFPDGIPKGREDDALVLARMFDKMKRIATNNDPFGESPWDDLVGYALLKAKTTRDGQAVSGIKPTANLWADVAAAAKMTAESTTSLNYPVGKRPFGAVNTGKTYPAVCGPTVIYKDFNRQPSGKSPFVFWSYNWNEEYWLDHNEARALGLK